MRFSSRKLLFMAGWIGIPLFFWMGRVEPALDRGHTALETREGADELHASGRRSVARRDRLESEWISFRDEADLQLATLDTDLHPHLVQKRVFESAARLEIDIDIQEEAGEGRKRFSVRGEGSWDSFVLWVQELECGPHRVRFESLRLVLPEESYSDGGGTRVEAVFAIPEIPAEVAA